MGETPHADVTARRIEAARDLLATSDLTLPEIALACGFSSQAHLTTRFRQRTGTTPAAWRRAASG